MARQELKTALGLGFMPRVGGLSVASGPDMALPVLCPRARPTPVFLLQEAHQKSSSHALPVGWPEHTLLPEQGSQVACRGPSSVPGCAGSLPPCWGVPASPHCSGLEGLEIAAASKTGVDIRGWLPELPSGALGPALPQSCQSPTASVTTAGVGLG